jgi:Rod binding domain-containing protein
MDILQTAQMGNIADTSQVDALQNIASKPDSDASKLEDVAKKFEGILLHEMFKQVQQSIETLNEGDEEDGEGSSDACGQQYQSLYWSQMADAVSEQGGLGFWKSIYGQIHRQGNKAENAGELLSENI